MAMTLSMGDEKKILREINKADIVNGEYVVPEGIEAIGSDAFMDLDELRSIKLPSTLKSIGGFAFQNCKNLSEIILPEGIESISEGAFSGCSSLKNVVLPDSCTMLGKMVFTECKSLESVKLPKNLKKLRNASFYKCINLKSVQLPENIESIDDLAFAGCLNLEEVNLPETLTHLGSSSFEGCQNIKSITIPKGIHYLRGGTFKNCISLKNISLPETLSNIDSACFYGCGSLEKIKLPSNLLHLGASAFTNCKNLTKVNIPKSINTLESNLFLNCIQLKDITIPDNINFIKSSVFSNTQIEHIIIPETVQQIESSVFKDCRFLKSVKLPSNLTRIPDQIFHNCPSLEDITLPEQVSVIGKNCFSNCIRLHSINIPNSVKVIGNEAFSNCSYLNNISLHNGIKELGNGVFKGCSNLTSLEIPNTITNLPVSFFSGCTNLENVKLPDSLMTIERKAFNYCKKLKEINIPESVTKIEEESFANCSGLEKIVIPSKVTEIENSAFESCYGLKNVVLPEGIKKIDYSAFSDCYNLTEINLPSTLEIIEPYAFGNCKKLDNLTLPNNLTEIGDYAFFNSALSSITLPSNLKKLGSNSFNILKINEILIPSSVKTYRNTFSYSNLVYFTQADSGFILSDSPKDKSYNLLGFAYNTDLAFLSRYMKVSDKLIREMSNASISEFYSYFINKLPEDKILNFINSHNFTFYKQIINTLSSSEHRMDEIYRDQNSKQKLFKMLYNLGVFEPSENINGKVVNFAQKISVFLQSKIEDFEYLIKAFNNCRIEGVKKEFVEFFINNYDELISEEVKNNGFISRCYNEFEEVQKTNTNNHGGQRQLKATIEKFKNYFRENKYEGINPDTIQIANTISPYFDDQKDFDNAVRIDRERKENNIPDHILSVPVSEKGIFENIENYANSSIKLRAETLVSLISMTDNEFSFEWLAKNDPKNFILGKLCSCCAHLEGVGYGIMHASIVHPNVQNLVIRNKKGGIVAKSTLYINPKERYGVFNTVEVNSSIPYSSLKQIYDKLIMGIKVFAEQYNKEHPDCPLKQINMGMGLNDVEDFIKLNNKRATKLLKPIDYGDFGIGTQTYPGDSSELQYIVWKDNINKDKGMEK